MEIKLHFLPEKPTKSCKVIVCKTLSNGDLWKFEDADYSTYWGLVHMTDEREELPKCIKEINEIITAWAYFDEAKEEYKDEVLR